MDYYSSIFAGTDFSGTPLSLWKLIETNFYLCIWKTSVPFYPSLFLLKKSLSAILRLPLPCPAWLHKVFLLQAVKSQKNTCVFWVQCTPDLWVQSCKLKDGRCPATEVTQFPSYPKISSHNLRPRRDTMKDPFQTKLQLLCASGAPAPVC